MPAFSSVLGALALAGGLGLGINAMTSSSGGAAGAPPLSPPPSLPPVSPVPAPEKAEDLAKAEIEKQRRIRALAGGKTILASEGPVLSSGAGKTLLGS